MQLCKALSDIQEAVHPLKPSGFFHLHPQLSKPINSPAWPEKVPNSDDEGMYFLFDAFEHLIFIGYAQNGVNIQQHLNLLFSYHPQNGTCVVEGDAWPSLPCYVVTLPLENANQGASIRNYLMQRFPDLPNVRINLIEERAGKKTYPLWQYFLAIALAPLGTAMLLMIIIMLTNL